MKILGDRLALSATDLSAHLGCHHLTQQNLRAARGELERPYFDDPTLEVLREKGIEHEAQYLQHLKSQGLSVIELPEHAATPKDTLAAMHEGADVIFQAALDDGRWRGRADFLLKTAGASGLGDYHYEVVDTKLARETRAGTVLQLCLYAELVGQMQGRRPDRIMVVSPGKGFEPEIFRVDHYYAYYQLVKRRLDEAAAFDPGNAPVEETYPEPCARGRARSAPCHVLAAPSSSSSLVCDQSVKSARCRLSGSSVMPVMAHPDTGNPSSTARSQASVQ